MPLTNSDIALQRLHNQRLTAASLQKPSDVVGWLVASQAQDYAGAKWALGMRMQTATDDIVERAVAKGTILRSHLLRPTWHFVTPADIRWLLVLTAPRVHALNGTMYRKLELDAAIFKRSTAALTKALRDGKQLTRDELRIALAKAGIATKGELRMGYLLMHAELEEIICSGARRGKQFTYASLDERAPQSKAIDRKEAVAQLVERFFMSRGPASAQDFAKWSGLTLADARSGLEHVKFRFEKEIVNGEAYWFSESKLSIAKGPPTAHLLSIYDEYISSYKDRSAIGGEEVAAKLRELGNALTGVIVLDGQVVGNWKRTLRKQDVLITLDLIAPMTKAGKQAVHEAAERYGKFVNLPVVIVQHQTARDAKRS